MGQVFRAHDQKLDRDVALKVLPEGSLSDPEARKRFQGEANALSRLSHPHVATIHDFDSAEGIDFLVMELVRGPSLRDEIDEKGALPEKTVVRLGSQLARGLQAAHEQGIVHRDLKPSNLQLTPDGLLKILDFGLALLLHRQATPREETAPTETAVGIGAGTLLYMSPEQLRGRGVDARTDLYAVGAVLYEMATGRHLFSKPSSAELTDAILHEEPRPPRELNERISPGLEALIRKALDKDPELRYQTAKELLVDLERLQLRPDSRPSGSGPKLEVATGPAPTAGDGRGAVLTRRRGWRRPLGFLAIGAALGTLAAAWIWNARTTGPPRITAVRALTTLTPPNPAWNGVLYGATDGSQLYVVTAKDGRNFLRQMPLTGGDASETPLPFRGAAFLLCAIPGRSEVVMAGSLDELSPAVADEGWPLWRVPVGGGAPQRIADLLARSADASPDGRSLALLRGNAIVLASIDGSNPRELHRLASAGYRLEWAPDGRRLRFTALRPGDSQETWIWEVSVTDGAPTPLWPGYGGAWTGDGRHYLFHRQGNLFVAPESGWMRWGRAAPEPLTSGALQHALVGSSSDGRRLVAFLFPPDSEQGGILMRYDRERKAFEPALGGESAMYARPSPDGRWLAWVRYPEGTLWRSRPDGSDRLRLSSPPAVAHFPDWSPDGARIAYSSQPDRARFWKEIRVVAADGTESESVARPTPEPGMAYWDPCWLPDGSIVFSQTRNEVLGILRYDPRTRSVETLPGAEKLLYPKCSASGDLLATEYDRGRSRWMLRRWGRTEWRALGSFTHANPTFSRDGRSVCALSVPGYRIECMDVDEGRMRTLADTSTLQLATWVFVPWMGLDAEDRPLVTVTAGPQTTSTVYALDWEAP
jgi:hypothetical protein